MLYCIISTVVLTLLTHPRSMIPSNNPLFSALGSLKYMRAVPCRTNQCLCQSLAGLDFMSQPFFRLSSSWGDGAGIWLILGTVSGAGRLEAGVVLVTSSLGVVDSDTSRPHPSGTPRTGSVSPGAGLESLWGDARDCSSSDWGESIWMVGCWVFCCVGSVVAALETSGVDASWVGASEYFTEEEETLAEKRGVGGNSVLDSLDAFLLV